MNKRKFIIGSRESALAVVAEPDGPGVSAGALSGAGGGAADHEDHGEIRSWTGDWTRSEARVCL